LATGATYNVTVWARAPEDEHRLLWRVLAALGRNPVFPEDLHGGEHRIKDRPWRLPHSYTISATKPG
jgi:hypothetical protein